MIKNRLSHTAVSKFQSCPKSYHFHYVERLRNKITGSSLIFGAALDTALNVMLTKPEESYLQAFEKAFRFAKVNNVEEYIPESNKIGYSDADFDKDLLEQEDIDKIREVAQSLNFKDDIYEIFNKTRQMKAYRGWVNVSKNYQKVFSLMNWFSLYRKGIVMLDAYKEDVIPKIKEVLAVQKEISLVTPDGDSIIGFIDLIAKWEDGSVVIFDNKTSARDYEANSASTSPQLILYAHAVGEEYRTNKVGFIVLNKQILKNKKKVCSSCKFKAPKGSSHRSCFNTVEDTRCGSEWIESIDPKAKVQVIIDTVKPELEQMVLENFADINHMIKQGIFTRNLNSCKNTYGLCPYFKKCWQGDDSELEKV